jgi:hypothetical protein
MQNFALQYEKFPLAEHFGTKGICTEFNICTAEQMLPIQRVMRVFLSKCKAARENDHPLPSTASVKNAQTFTSYIPSWCGIQTQ